LFKRPPTPREIAVAAVLLVILVITLTPAGNGPPLPFSFELAVGGRWLADAILNLCLFVPLGFALGWKSRSPVKAVWCGLLLSTTVEMAQMWIPGRDPSLSDIIFNTAGTAVGALIGLRPRVWLVPDARNSVALTAFGVAAAALVMTITALLLAPVQSPALPNNMQLRLSSSPRDRSENMVTLRVINVSSAEEPFSIGRSGNDLVLQYPSRADAAGLDQPVYWLAHAFPDSSNADTTVSLRRERARWYVSVAGKRATLGPTVGEGWTLLAYPDAIARRWGRVVNALWIAALCLPIGFWARGQRLPIAAALVVALFLALIPGLTGVAGTSVEEWAGAGLGLLAGATLGLLSKRLARAHRLRG